MWAHWTVQFRSDSMLLEFKSVDNFWIRRISFKDNINLNANALCYCIKTDKKSSQRINYIF